MKKILPISIIMIAIVVCSMSCSSDKGKTSGKGKGGKQKKTVSIELPYKSAKYQGLDTDGGDFISFVDGNSVYVAMPDGANSTKLFEAKFPKNTYHHYLSAKNGKDYIEIFMAYWVYPDLEYDSSVSYHFLVNIHTANITVQVKGPGINKSNKNYPFHGVFIPGTNSIIYNKVSYSKTQVYDVENKTKKTISGCHYEGLFSSDRKWCYFDTQCAKLSSDGSNCLKEYVSGQLLAYNMETDKIIKINNEADTETSDVIDYTYSSLVYSLSNDNEIIAYVLPYMQRKDQEIYLRDTKLFRVINRIKITVPIHEEHGQKWAYRVKKLSISPSHDKIAYILFSDEPFDDAIRYFDVVDTRDGRVVKHKINIDGQEEIEWIDNNTIVLKKWNGKFNKDKGKKEKPYIERVINVGE